MGFRFRKSIKLGGGFRLNLSKGGLGISGGVKGVRVGIGPRGVRTSLSIPGTGTSYVTEKRLKRSPAKQPQQTPVINIARPYKGTRWLVGAIFGLIMIGTDPGPGLLVAIVCGIRYYTVRLRLKQLRSEQIEDTSSIKEKTF